jgi:hypothetical protein
MLAAKWHQAPAVDVRRGWETQWQHISEDFWTSVAAVRAAHPFPSAPTPEHHPTVSPKGSMTPLVATTPRQEAAGGAPMLSLSELAAQQRRKRWTILLAKDDSALAEIRHESVPGIGLRAGMQAYGRVWTLASDQRIAATTDLGDVRAPEFIAIKLRREIRQVINATFVVMYDLGVSDEHAHSSVEAAMPRTPLMRAGTVPVASTPLRREWTRAFEDAFDDAAGLMPIPSAERVAMLEWAAQVLLTLRLHCRLLMRPLRAQFKVLEQPAFYGPGYLDTLIANEVEAAFLHRQYYRDLVRAVASLEHPSRMGVVPPGAAAAATTAAPSNSGVSGDLVLTATVAIVKWAMDCGLTDIVACFAGELKQRWAAAAAQIVDSLSPELSPVATAQELLKVVEHCDELVVQLGDAIGLAHVAAVRAEIAQAVLNRDTVGLIVRSLFNAALHSTGPIDNYSEDNTGSDLLFLPADGSVAGLWPPPAAPFAMNDAQLSAAAPRDTPGATGASLSVFAQRASDLLLRVLSHSGGVQHAREELGNAIADHLYDAVSGGDDAAGDEVSGGVGASATPVPVSGHRRVVTVSASVTPVLHLLDAIAATRKVLRLDHADYSLKRASLDALRRTPRPTVQALTAMLGLQALSDAVQHVVRSYSEAFETALADMLFGGTTGLDLDDFGDDLLALCERVRGVDRLIESCKHAIAARFLSADTTADARRQDGVAFGSHGVPSSIPSLSAAQVVRGTSAVARAMDVHRALGTWLSAAAVAPLTALITELKVAFFVDSDTIASPMNYSVNDLADLAGSENDEDPRSPLTIVVGVQPPVAATALDRRLPTRPTFVVLCRCLAGALWAFHVPHCATRRSETSGIDNTVVMVTHVRAFGGPDCPLQACVDWLQFQYAAAYPKRRLQWPALVGEVRLAMRAGPSRDGAEPAVRSPRVPDLASPTNSRSMPVAPPPAPRRPEAMIITYPIVALLLLQFNSRPTLTQREVEDALAPLDHLCVEKLLTYLAGLGIITAKATVGSTDTGSHSVAAVLPRARRVHATSVHWTESERRDVSHDEPPRPVPNHAAIDTLILASRQRAVEAAIVRVLKSRKLCTGQELFAAVSHALQERFPLDNKIFKASVDLLEGREYIRREGTPSSPVFTYVA